MRYPVGVFSWPLDRSRGALGPFEEAVVKRFLTLNPAAILFAVNAVVAMAVAWGAKLSPDTTAGITAAVTAVITIVTAASTRPVGLQAVVGGATALAVAGSGFGLHLTTPQIGTAATVLSLVLAGVFHLAHVPVAAAKLGTTANELQLADAAAPARS
jgi:uncharacterized membrane protein YccC